MTLKTGEGADNVAIGQLYNAPHSYHPFVERTTRGYLSSAGTQSITIDLDDGDDVLRVLKTGGNVLAKGGCGDDFFISYSFLLWNTNQTVLTTPANSTNNPTPVKLFGQEGNDQFQYASSAAVTADGGPGNDIFVMLLTERADHVVLSDDGVFGGGLALNVQDIERVIVSLGAGDDRFYALSSSSSSTPIEVIGGDGSDGFFVAPSFAVAVQANPNRGHSGLLSHVVSSEDAEYASLAIGADVDANALQRLPSATASGLGTGNLASGTGVDGVSIDVYDADTTELMVDVRNSASVLLETPAGVDATSFSYDVYLSGEPNEAYESITVSVSVGAPGSDQPNGRYIEPRVTVDPVSVLVLFCAVTGSECVFSRLVLR